jgi:SOS-response transcriptional repressor LexA
MHEIQSKMLHLAADRDIVGMKLVELARILDIKHLQQVKYHREQLIKKGRLENLNTGKATRIIRDILPDSDLIEIPILGAANAGPASIYADGVVKGYLRVSSSLLPAKTSREKLFAWKIIGDSMNKARVNDRYSIEDGDYVIADAKPFKPVTGDYVISLFSGKANVKRFFRTPSEQIALISESTEDYPPIVVSEHDPVEYLTQAKVISVAKTPKEKMS